MIGHVAHLEVRQMMSVWAKGIDKLLVGLNFSSKTWGYIFPLVLPEASKKSKAKKLAKALDTKE